MKTRCALLSIALLLPASTASGQHARGAIFIEAGPALATQSGPSDSETQTYVAAPGGTTLGWLVGGGVHVAPRADALAEWSTTGWMSASEPSRYFTTYNEERRDRFLTLAIRFTIPVGRSVALEPIAGTAFTFPEAWSQAVHTDPVAPRPPQPRIAHQLNTGFGPAFGLDAPIGTGRILVVPSVRLLRSAVSEGRYDDSDTSPVVDIGSIYPGGYPEWTIRSSISLRLTF